MSCGCRRFPAVRAQLDEWERMIRLKPDRLGTDVTGQVRLVRAAPSPPHHSNNANIMIHPPVVKHAYSLQHRPVILTP